MVTNFLFLFLFLFFLNLKQSFELEIVNVNPLYLNAQSGGLKLAVILTFNEIVDTNTNSLKLVYTNKDWNTTLQRAEHTSDTNPNRATFTLVTNDLFNKGNFGYYKIYYGDITTDLQILIYPNLIRFRNPIDRYFLKEKPNIKNKVNVTFELKSMIITEEINRVSLKNKEGELYNCTYYLEDNGISLTITLNTSDQIDSYIFSVYPTYDRSTSSPPQLTVYFQDFFVYYEAVYAKASAESTSASLKVKFADDGHKEGFDLSYLGSGSTSIIKGSLIQNIDKNHTYNFVIKNPTPGVINITYNNQVRPIFLITYQTNDNKCYINGDTSIFHITFYKTSQMEYTHSIYFNTDPEQTLAYINDNEKSDELSYTGEITYLYNGTFNLYSFISRLSSNEPNPIDISSLSVRIHDDPHLVDSQSRTLFIGINHPQYLELNVAGAGDINEVFLENKGIGKSIPINLGECDNIDKNKYNCTKITNILMNLDESYISNNYYTVEYDSGCDNQRLEIEGKHITIGQGYTLLNVNPNWTFIDNVKTQEVTLTYKEKLNGFVMVFFCEKGSMTKCGGKYLPASNINTIKVNLFEVSLNGTLIYDIFSAVNGQLNQRNSAIFKIVERLNFTFNHRYFVKDNGAEQNYLEITKDFYEESNNIIYIIQDSNAYMNLTTDNNRSFIYDIYNLQYFSGVINFRYYDNDIKTYIPIDKHITVVGKINELMNMNIANCYYFKFKLIITKSNPSYNFNERIFLVNNNNNNIVEFKKDNNEYKLENDINSLIGNDNLYFYISEETIDTTIYLYKSKFSLTKLEVPEYIIYPNNSLYFSSVTCDLCNSILLIHSSSISNNGIRINSDCHFSQKSITINGYFTNFNYYYYSLNDEGVTDTSSNSYLRTFRSIQLSRSNFKIDIDTESSNTQLKINLTNTNKDFYCDLIDNLTLYKIYNGKNESKILTRNELQINDFVISFTIEKGNFDLDINHLTRRKDPWETEVDSSFFYYFGNVTNHSIFTVTPTVFASHDLPNEELIINITFKNEEIRNSFENDLKDLCQNREKIDNRTVQCKLSNEDIRNEPIKLKKYLSDYLIEIDLIYYNLSSSSNCMAIKELESTFDLIIYTPDDYYTQNKIYLKSNVFPNNIYQQESESKDKTITIPIDARIGDDVVYEIYVDNKLIHSFNLKEFGINFIPKFDFEESGRNIILLPEPNQVVKLTYSQYNIEGLSYSNNTDNINNISYFQIGNSTRSSSISNNYDNSINIVFDLSSFSVSQTNYILSYIDTCKNQINTGVYVRFLSFYFERHYFVINNNNEQTGQNLRIQGPINDQIQLRVSYIDDDNVEQAETISTNGIIYNYYLTKNGTYSFFYMNNGIRYNLSDKVYVFNYLSDLFNNNTNLTECMFYNTSKYLSFSYSFKNGTNNYNSIFNMTLRIDGYNQNYSLNSVINNNMAYILTYNNIQNRISQDRTLLIYLYENNDMAQPLYRYKYKYTNITLNSYYEDVIYSDTNYISFNMSCKIENLQGFDLYQANSPNSKKGTIKCNDLEESNTNGVYNCFLFENDKTNNPINDSSSFVYDYYIMKYDSKDVSLKQFFVSKDIANSEFNLQLEEEIHTDRNTTVRINSTKNEFFIPYLNYLYFNYTSSTIGYVVPITINNVFNKENNYFEFKLFLQTKQNFYNLTRICRKKWEHCRNGQCKYFSNKDDYEIRPNIPDISLIFNRRYISLRDSLYKNAKSKELIINFGGEDVKSLTHIKYQIYKTSTSDFNRETEIDVRSMNNYAMDVSEYGMYKFLCKSSLRVPYINKDFLVFVVNYDYELLNLNHLNDNCMYYDPNQRILFTTLMINNNYLFKNNASTVLNDLQIYFGDQVFNYINGSYGYQLHDSSYAIDCENDEYNFYIIENNDQDYVFTSLSSKKNCTSPYFNDYYYKDNIILTNQRCALNNIYLADINSPGSKSKLNCDFIENQRLSYCNINQRKFDVPNIIFDIYFNYENNYLKSDNTMNIYNSINDSLFDLSFSEPRLSIISSNFDLRNLSIVDIDEEEYANSQDFIDQKVDNVTFIYYLQNKTSYVTKLTRRDRTDDRDTTIKYKNESLEIKEIDCDEFFVPHRGECLQCYFLSRYGLINSNFKWYQNGRCVDECDYNSGYAIYDSNHFYCRKCAERTIMTDPESRLGYKYVCSCLVGTVKSFEDQVCYLPEDEEIAKLRNIQTRVQCYKADGEKHNYCSDNAICTVKNKNGYLFPFCDCNSGYTGRYCELDENNINLDNNLTDTFTEDNKIDEFNIVTIARIRSITYFFEEEGNKKLEQITNDNINNYIQYSLDIIDEIKNNEKKTVPQIFDVMELAIYFLKERILNHRNLRNLQEEEQDREKLDKIINNLHYLNVKANNASTGNFKIQTDKLNLATFIVYKKSDLEDASFLEEMSDENYFKIMEYVNISETDVDDKVFITLINSSLYNETFAPGDFGVKAYISTTNDTNGTNTLLEKNNVIFYISSSVIHFNFDLAEYYSNKNIRIYDKNDKAFTDPCFLSEDFDFDLTQKYRKKNLYQKITFGNDVCKYVKFEYEYNKYNRLIFECQNFTYFDNISEVQYGMLEFNFKRDRITNEDKVYNLPTKCTKIINNIGENFAFWFFLIICLFEIIYCAGLTVLNYGSLKKVSYRKGLIHDEIYQVIPFKKNLKNKEDAISNSEHMAKQFIKESYKKSYRKSKNHVLDEISDFSSDILSQNPMDKSFLECFRDNLKELHPIASLCRVSLISPLIINSVFFVFNTLILFGFNALIYDEDLIEKRIYRPYRNNFGYPMRKEFFYKIFPSILLQICFCVIAKVILIVTINQKNRLKDKLRTCYKQEGRGISNDIVIKVDEFQNELFLRRILSCVFMVIIIVFFFYYSVAFCGVYIQTQRNWFFSGIWSLFWNWIVFAPIYIAVVSFLESSKKDPDNTCIYYSKRLFCF